MSKGKIRTVKVVRSFYVYHPHFITKDDGSYEQLPTGYWGVEWTIKELHNPILEHYMAKFGTEQEAQAFLEKLGDITGFFRPYEEVDEEDDMFIIGKLMSFIDQRKKA